MGGGFFAHTGERTLPVLDAAHIKRYAASGRHELRVSRRIREEFENGRDYYALEGSTVRLPLPPALPPSAE